MTEIELVKKHSDLIWTIANLLRGPYRPPQYRRVMIPLVVLRRLDCVLEETKADVLARYNQLKAEGKYDEETIEKMLFRKFGLKFFNVSSFTFATREKGLFARLVDDPDGLASNLSAYMAGFSGNARKILEKFKFEEELEKLDESNRLFEIIQKFSEVDFHPDRISNVNMGYIFEDLVRRFNEQANEEAGDHFTPREVIHLMVSLLFTGDEIIYTPGKVLKIYDPTCGTGGMLSVSEEYIRNHNPDANVELFGQEYNPESYAICGSDLLIKGEDVQNIAFGDTLGTGRQKEGQVDGDGHADKHFHYMLANPPFGVEWKPEKDYVTHEHENLGFSGRFGAGLPRINDGALLFLQHMMSKMHAAPERGGEGSRIGIVFNGSPLFTGDAGGGESNIRRWIIENDWLEAVVGLPDQLFYNTGIHTYIWIVSNRKPASRKGKVQLIDATGVFLKMKKSLGNKRNRIGDNQIGNITRLYGEFTEGEQVKIFANRDFGYLKMVVERPLRLNFAVNEKRIEAVKKSVYFVGLATSKKRKAGKAEDIEVGKQKQARILAVLEEMITTEACNQKNLAQRRKGAKDSNSSAALRLERSGREIKICLENKNVKGSTENSENGLVKDRAVFEKVLEKGFHDSEVKLDAALKKALLAPGALGEKDPMAEICRDKKGNPEPDPDLRDTENVDLPEGIALPLPLEYEGKKNKGKVDKSGLLELVREHCEEYLKREVLPYRPDAWIDHDKIKVGYEIPFTRHFYKYSPPRPLNKIAADIRALETEIVRMLAEVTA
jgi:type I restriction enzyme M protein